jgi:hypothetical protein
VPPPALDPDFDSPETLPRTTRRVVTRVLPCSRCRRPLDLRFEFGAPSVVKLGHRDSVKLAFRCPDCGHVNERWSTDLVRYARTLGQMAAPDIVAGLVTLMHGMHEKALVPGEAAKDAAIAAQAAGRLGKLVLELGQVLTRKVEVEVREVPSEQSRVDAVVDELVAEIRRRQKGEAVAEGVAAAAGVDLSAEKPEPPAAGDGASAGASGGAAAEEGKEPPVDPPAPPPATPGGSA